MGVKVKVGNNADQAKYHLVPGKNIYTGSKVIVREFNEPLNSLEEDLLNLASGIYCADLAVKREERERFIRTIEFDIEVVNYHLFERIKDKLRRALLILSSDNWMINFIEVKGKPVSQFQMHDKEGIVLLFSGGIDSMCAASEFLKTNNNIVLVSHTTHGNEDVSESQNNVRECLEYFYKTKIKHLQIKIYGRNTNMYNFPKDQKRENTQRTRSLLFLTLGAIITRRSGYNKVLYMAENGQFAIHIPLNRARIGPFSTHTADPEFLNILQDIFRTLLNNSNFEILNPFLYKTKSEVFSLLPDELKNQAQKSISCWMYSRGKIHCGECIPCISRRIAIESNGLSFNEYNEDIFNSNITNLPDHSTGKRNIIDYIEFILKFQNFTPNDKEIFLLDEAQELLNNSIDQNKALDMYIRLAQQSLSVFSKYPNIQRIL